jgi:hypothetical protein
MNFGLFRFRLPYNAHTDVPVYSERLVGKLEIGQGKPNRDGTYGCEMNFKLKARINRSDARTNRQAAPGRPRCATPRLS